MLTVVTPKVLCIKACSEGEQHPTYPWITGWAQMASVWYKGNQWLLTKDGASSQSLGLQLIFSKSLSLVPVPPETVFSAYTTSQSACFMCQIGHRGTWVYLFFLISLQTSQVAPPLLSLASCTASNEILSPWVTTCSIFRDPSALFWLCAVPLHSWVTPPKHTTYILSDLKLQFLFCDCSNCLYRTCVHVFIHLCLCLIPQSALLDNQIHRKVKTFPAEWVIVCFYFQNGCKLDFIT